MGGRGPEGIVAARPSPGHVHGEEGRPICGGYAIEDLTEHASFEEVCHLPWYGNLPQEPRLDRSRREPVMEQHAGNRLVRPASAYGGPLGRQVRPIEERT